MDEEEENDCDDMSTLSDVEIVQQIRVRAYTTYIVIVPAILTSRC